MLPSNPIFRGGLCQADCPRTLAHSLLDAICDLVDVPLALVTAPNIEELHHILLHEFQFFRKYASTVNQFRDLISLANANPPAIFDVIRRAPRSWRPIFERIYEQIYITRNCRPEPVIRLLRDHWCWRWVETLALYDHILSEELGSNSLQFYEKIKADIWSVNVLPWFERNVFLLVGPLRNRRLPPMEYANGIRDFILLSEQMATTVDFPPIHVLGRYEQFLYERSAWTDEQLDAIKDRLSRTVELMSSLHCEENYECDDYDVTEIAKFTYFVADLIPAPARAAVSTSFKMILTYPMTLASEVVILRRLIYRRDVGTSHTEPIILTVTTAPTSPGGGEWLDLEGLPGGLKDQLVGRFDQIERKRRVTQSHRMLEELLILRFRLIDDFIVITTNALDHALLADIAPNLGKRISRAAARICNADNAVLYRYDPRRGVLGCVGGYSEQTGETALTRTDYLWMEEAGLSPDRSISVAYAALDDQRSACYNGGTTFTPSPHNIASFLAPPPSSTVPAGKSVIAVPIRLLGRRWGVLEVVSRRANAFSHLHLDILEKIADLVAPQFHEQSIMSALYQIANEGDTEEDTGAALDRLAGLVSEIFIAESACVWVKELFSADRFTCYGFTGRPDLQMRRDRSEAPPVFHMNDPLSISGQAIRERKVWVFGEIGVEPFNGRWLEKAHTSQLLVAGKKYIAIMPVYDLDQQPLGVVTIYTGVNGFSEPWDRWARYISSYLGVVITRVHNVRQIERLAARMLAHEIGNYISILREAAIGVQKFVENVPAFVSRPPKLNVWLSDLGVYIDDIAKTVGAVGSEISETQRQTTLLLATAEARSRTPVGGGIDLAAEVNSCIQAHRGEIQDKGIHLDVNYPRRDFTISLHAENFRLIINNLISNAIKYSTPASTISFGVIEQRNTMRLVLKNIGKPLEDGESMRIFNLGFRGAEARTRGTGSGLGLYISRRICRLYDADLNYQFDKIEKSTERGWHQFQMDIPNRLIRSLVL